MGMKEAHFTAFAYSELSVGYGYRTRYGKSCKNSHDRRLHYISKEFIFLSCTVGIYIYRYEFGRAI
jgi:hypothetical protein